MPEPDENADAYQTAREEALSWLKANWDPALPVREWWARLADSGWGFPSWPAEWFGRGLSADAAAGVRSAYAAAGVLPPPTGLGQMLGGPMLLVHGSQEQKARFLPALVRGEEMWCQFFSEPGSGSDLASAQTRAVPGSTGQGAGWTVNGQKVWTSGAQWSDRGMLLARTNREVPKHHGLSFFIIDLNQSGIQVRPLHQMNGDHGFNEVFFTDAHVDDDRLVGEAGNGWSVAVTVLMFERLMSGVPSVMPGSKGGNLDTPAGAAAERAARARATGRTSISDLILSTAAALAETSDPVLRQRLAQLRAKETINGYLARSGQGARGQSPAAGSGGGSAGGGSAGGPTGRGRPERRPSSQGSLVKLARSQLTREGRDTGMAVLGAQGMLASPDTPGGGEIQHRALSAAGSSIAGGTDEIQRGIVGERVLGLPKEPRTDRDVPFKDLTIGTQRPGS